jgi:hypothetical protein
MDFTKFMARYRETVKREGGYAARMQKHLAAEKVDAAQVYEERKGGERMLINSCCHHD